MRPIRIAAATAVLLLVGSVTAPAVGAAETVYSGNLRIQQVIVGGQTVTPTGANGYPRLSVGYAYRIETLAAGESAALTISSPAFEFSWRCVANTSTTGKWHINAPNATRTVTTNAWFPSANAKDPSTIQNTAGIPNSCQGGAISIRSGTYVNAISTTLQKGVAFRWHYVYCTSASSCTNGAWTQAFTITPNAGGVYPPAAVGGLHLVRPVVQPEQVPFTGAEIGGMVAGGLILLGGGTLLLLAARRRRRHRTGW
jgi:hypothetical protein